MVTLNELNKETNNIKKRNKKVEADKAWENSLTRKMIIAFLTYLVIVLLFYFAWLPDPLINSIVPALTFMLSTLSIPSLRSSGLRTSTENRCSG